MTTTRFAIGQQWADKRDKPRLVEIVRHRHDYRSRLECEVKVIVPNSWATNTVGRKTWVRAEMLPKNYVHQEGQRKESA